MANKPIATSESIPWNALVGITLAGLLVGLGAGFVVDLNADFFKRPEEYRAYIPPYPLILQEEIPAIDAALVVKNTTLAVGVVGALLGACLGTAAGMKKGTVPCSLLGLGLGLALGGGFGALGGFANAEVMDHLLTRKMLDGNLQASVAHGVGWVCVCLGISLAVGFLLPPRGKLIGKLLLGTIVAAIVAAVLYPILAGLIYPNARMSNPLPEGTGNRLMWVALTAGLISLAAARVLARYEEPTTTL